MSSDLLAQLERVGEDAARAAVKAALDGGVGAVVSDLKDLFDQDAPDVEAVAADLIRERNAVFADLIAKGLDDEIDNAGVFYAASIASRLRQEGFLAHAEAQDAIVQRLKAGARAAIPVLKHALPFILAAL